MINYLVGAAGLALGLTLAGAGGWAYDNWIDDPAVRSETRAICVSEASAAASEARAAQLRRSQVQISKLQRDFDALLNERLVSNLHVRAEIEDEISKFETDVGSACSVTVDNLEFLRPK